MKRISIDNVRNWLLAAVLFGGPAALHPSISIPVFNFPSFRIGLYQMVIVLFVLSCLPLLWSSAKKILSNKSTLLSLIILLITVGVGLIFTYTPARTVMYSAALLLLIVVGFSTALAFSKLSKLQKSWLINFGLWSGVVFSIVAIGQLIIASFDPTAFGSLCDGCKASVFGFPRINGLAAEPQFLASALLPSFFVAFFYRNKLSNWSLPLTSISIVLTFSRGAFLAIAGAILIYAIIRLTQKESIKHTLKPVAVSLVGIIIGLIMLLISATIRYSNTPNITQSTAQSMASQLSMGLIPKPEKPKSTIEKTEDKPSDFTPAGFVEASSEERLTAAEQANRAWVNEPRTTVFGTGLGNLGAYLQKEFNSKAPTDQTVYIFYILILSNMGIAGLLLLVFVLLKTLWRANLAKPSKFSSLAITLSAAIIIQFWFFGSLINTVHCFAWIAIFLYNLPHKQYEKS